MKNGAGIVGFSMVSPANANIATRWFAIRIGGVGWAGTIGLLLHAKVADIVNNAKLGKYGGLLIFL